ncbi:MAG: glycosyltransferase [Bacteroidales bacterium]|jgi:glycosyltransferase involved in cell wall biosynthesis|nr:glycosyltransferase [Bacteroidales bacterium]
MIKIAHISTVHRREDIRIFEKECCSLATANYQVNLIVADGKGDETKNNVSIYDIGKFNGRFRRLLHSASRAYIKALELNCDIYHCHDPELLPCCLKLKRRNKHIIFDSHEDIYANINEKHYIPAFIKPLVSFILSIYQSYVLKRIDGVISVTPHICQRLKKYNKNTVMVTNYPIIKSANIPKQSTNRTLVFAGGITYQWRHDILLDALSFCEGVTYNLCGSAYEDCLEMLKQHKNWNKVNFFGVLPKNKVEELMSKSSIGIAILMYGKNVGGKNGTLGNTKLFEYMEASLPFICTDFVLWKEIVQKYECGICVNPLDVQGIAKAIQYLIDNPQIAKEMGENGRKAVEKEYNWQSQERILLDFYNKICGLMDKSEATTPS